MQRFWEDEISEGYYDKIFKDGFNSRKGIQPAWHFITFEKVGEFIKAKDSHLDYACGPGTFINFYGNRTSVGVDLAIKQINYANKTYGNKNIFKTLDEFNYQQYENKFNVITVLGLIEFIDQDEFLKLIKNLKSMLCPGGEIIFTTPNFSIGMNILNLFIDRFGQHSYTNHYTQKYTIAKLRNFLIENDLKEFSIKKFLNFGVFFAIFNIKIAKKIEFIFEKIFFGFFGFLLILVIKK